MTVLPLQDSDAVDTSGCETKNTFQIWRLFLHAHIWPLLIIVDPAVTFAANIPKWFRAITCTRWFRLGF